MRRLAILALLLTGACGGGPETLAEYRAAYEAQWGPVDLTGWRVNIVAEKPVLDGVARTGVTWWGEKRIDIWIGALEAFPHELRHVALGPASADHVGWCEFGAWELSELHWDERTYLGCQ